jgi:hypothetical protein
MADLEFCRGHSPEIQAIRNASLESITLADKMGGKLFRPSFVFSAQEAAYDLLKWRKAYSEFSEIFLELLGYCHPDGIAPLYAGYVQMGDGFYNLYTECIAKHQSMHAYYQRGRIFFDRGLYEDCLSDIQPIIDSGQWKEANIDKKKEKEFLLTKGAAQLETGVYDKAIDTLSDLIGKDPKNKEAYYNRAMAYFEIGAFDQAVDDYITSGKSKDLSKIKPKTSKEFTDALLKGLSKGGSEAVIEFIPTLCNTVQGLGQALWSLTEQPVYSTVNFCNACYDVGEAAAEYFLSLDVDKIGGYVDEIKDLCVNFNRLNDQEKGTIIGHTIGKYGVEIFGGGVALKGIVAFKRLKAANRYCNLEAMTLSTANKEAIIASATTHAAERAAFLKTIKIHWDRQNKHIPGKHNFEPGKGIITLESSELEILVKEYAGTGQKIKGEFGRADYRERVDFGRIIGMFVQEVEGQPTQNLPTTKGIIHYAKNGFVHIVPSDPVAVIK